MELQHPLLAGYRSPLPLELHVEMDMSMSMSTTAAAAPAATSGAAMSMGGMDGMSMGGGPGAACKISMLWNWYTVDACFISATWQITSPGMFAGSCIGVVLLTMSLGFLRRLHRAVDAWIAAGAVAAVAADTDTATPRWWIVLPSRRRTNKSSDADSSDRSPVREVLPPPPPPRRAIRRPSVLEQALRALLHTAQFAVAYFVMLLAMYYNGYIIICILIGAFLGYFVFEWGPLPSERAQSKDAATEVTGCCG